MLSGIIVAIISPSFPKHIIPIYEYYNTINYKEFIKKSFLIIFLIYNFNCYYIVF
ncbi:hypothetical protein NT01CX_0324 [Clostridium novyi NT]|uniref:Uncharacterized protein n=1 Tax=Clostridium novyi (strain NT) TaxID=386415 RepID=A0Q2H0_CLONN|nr:hypothetical protein NT01CX_0324 [Clostridium novyi NT]